MSKNRNNNQHNNNENIEVNVPEEEVQEEVQELEVKEEVEEKKEEIKINVTSEKKEEKKTDIKDLKPEVKGNKRIEEIDKEIAVLQAKLNKCFSPITQVTLDEKIKLLKAEKNDILKKKMKIESVSVGGETIGDANIQNNVIPAGRGIVMDTRATTTVSLT